MIVHRINKIKICKNKFKNIYKYYINNYKNKNQRNIVILSIQIEE